MTLFAHTETGFALDPQDNASADDYLARYHSGVTSGWNVAQVPEGTAHGAKDNGDGTFTNPVTPSDPKIPQPLSRLSFLRLCQSAGGMTDANLVSAKADITLAALWIKLDMAQQVERDDADTAAGLTALAALGYLPNGKDAVTGAWPTT